MSKSVAQEVLGITDPTDKVQAMKEAWATLTGGSIEDTIATSMVESGPEAPSRTTIERIADLRFLGEIILGDSIENATTLFHWPVYQELMEQHGTKAVGPATALQIGSLSAVSARTFACLARDVYGADQAITLDIDAGRDKLRHGTFLYGSGLNLPIKTQSVDFVHTNHLLQSLVDPYSKSELHDFASQTQRLMSEIERVLVPGGQLLMKEVPPAIRGKDATEIMHDIALLGEAFQYMFYGHGIDKVVVEKSIEYGTAAHLFDPERDFSNYEARTSLSGLRIYAQKNPA